MFASIMGGLFILIAIYALASSSGLFAERSGTINLAINGGMIMGAVGYIMTTKLLANSSSISWWMPILGFLVAIMFSIAITSLLSFATINLKGNHIIVGTAINILAPIVSLIIIIAISNGQQFIPTSNYQLITAFVTKHLAAWLIQLILLLFVGVIIAGLFYLMRFTSFGLRLRAAGENPHALAAAGISVNTTRHLAMIISGALAGLAGALSVAAFIKFSSYTSAVFGMGFIAIAILILGQWRMQWVLVGAIAFSAIYILAYVYGGKLDDKQWYVYMIPYITILCALPIVSIKQRAPKAEGIPYENTGR